MIICGDVILVMLMCVYICKWELIVLRERNVVMIECCRFGEYCLFRAENRCGVVRSIAVEYQLVIFDFSVFELQGVLLNFRKYFPSKLHGSTLVHVEFPYRVYGLLPNSMGIRLELEYYLRSESRGVSL